MRTWRLGSSLMPLWLALCISGCAGANAPPQSDDDQVGDDDDPPDPNDFDAHIDSPPTDLPDADLADAEDEIIYDADLTQPDARPIDPNLIDDLDDNNDHIISQNGRRGSWYTFHDDTVGGVQVPGDSNFPLAAGGPPGSLYCAHTTGHGFTDWGAGIGFDLNTPDGATLKGKFNAGAYTGISFKAKGNVPVRFAVQIAAVLETTVGGTCTPSMVEGQECDDVHGKTVTLTSSWQLYQIPFAMLTQEGWGKPAAFDKTTLTGVMFQTTPGASFDFSIDEVTLYH
jgi:Carbohydrate binding domain (family 11)